MTITRKRRTLGPSPSSKRAKKKSSPRRAAAATADADADAPIAPAAVAPAASKRQRGRKASTSSAAVAAVVAPTESRAQAATPAGGSRLSSPRRRASKRRGGGGGATKTSARENGDGGGGTAMRELEQRQEVARKSLSYELQWEAAIFFIAELVIIAFIIERITCRIVPLFTDTSNAALFIATAVAFVWTVVKFALHLGSSGERVRIRRSTQSARFTDERAALMVTLKRVL